MIGQSNIKLVLMNRFYERKLLSSVLQQDFMVKINCC